MYPLVFRISEIYLKLSIINHEIEYLSLFSFIQYLRSERWSFILRVFDTKIVEAIEAVRCQNGWLIRLKEYDATIKDLKKVINSSPAIE